jgi:hypothetical protein
MAATAPECPQCETPVQADWDWCQQCGFDPDGLKPLGWSAGGESGHTTLVAPAPARVRRRGRVRVAPPATPPPPTSTPVDGKFSSLPPLLPPLPPPGSAPARRPVTVSADRPAPRPKGRSPKGRSPKAPNPKAPNPKARRSPSVASPPAPVAASAERVFVAPRVPILLGLGSTLLVLAAFMAYWAGSGLVSLFHGGSGLNLVSTLLFILVCGAFGGALAVQGRALLRMRVVVTGAEVVSYGRSVRPHRAPIDEIYSVRLGQRPMIALLGEPGTVAVPYVQCNDGSGFWLDALGGISAERPPTEEQMAMLDRLVVLMEQRRSTAPAPAPLF